MTILYTDVAVTNMDVLTVTTFTLMEAWLMPKCTGNDQTICSLRNCLTFGDRSDHIWWQRHQLLPNDVHWDMAKLYGIENVRVTAWPSQLKPVCHASTEQGNSQNLSLRHYLLAQSQRHHIPNGLEERGIEKRKGCIIVLERTREGHCHSDEHWNFFKRGPLSLIWTLELFSKANEHWNCFKGNLRETFMWWGGEHNHGLFWAMQTPSWIEPSWTHKTGQPVPCCSNYCMTIA